MSNLVKKKVFIWYYIIEKRVLIYLYKIMYFEMRAKNKKKEIKIFIIYK